MKTFVALVILSTIGLSLGHLQEPHFDANLDVEATRVQLNSVDDLISVTLKSLSDVKECTRDLLAASIKKTINENYPDHTDNQHRYFEGLVNLVELSKIYNNADTSMGFVSFFDDAWKAEQAKASAVASEAPKEEEAAAKDESPKED